MLSISQNSLKVLRATASVVSQNSEKITSVFYPILFRKNPELLQLFNLSNHRPSSPLANNTSDVVSSPQQKTLADTIVAYATNIEKLENMSAAMTRITNKHCAVGVQPHHYQIVHDTLMEAIGKVLGDAATVEVAAAWSEAVMYLGNVMIDKEHSMYHEAEEKEGGWKGKRTFFVDSIVEETPSVRSLRMTPVDHKKISTFFPGQYITVFENPSREKYFAPRHYTLTSQPKDPFYQVSVKRMINPVSPNDPSHNGIMSHFLHKLKVGDEVHLGPIFGPALLELGKRTRPAVFVSLGIGITPTIAMLPTAIKERPSVAVFHGDFCGQEHPFTNYLEKYSKNALMSYSYFSPNEEDKRVKHFSEGLLTSHKIVETLQKTGVNPFREIDYYICCGPNETKPIVSGLKEAGVDPHCLHVEFFAPFDSSVTEDLHN